MKKDIIFQTVLVTMIILTFTFEISLLARLFLIFL